MALIFPYTAISARPTNWVHYSRQRQRNEENLKPVLSRSLLAATCLVARFKSRREAVGRRRTVKDDTDVERKYRQ
jgi:hypothetical protein